MQSVSPPLFYSYAIADSSSDRINQVDDISSEDISADELADNIREGRLEQLERLLLRGYDINHADDDTVPPLITAIFHGSVETVLLLLKHGADTDVIVTKNSQSICFHFSYALNQTDNISKIVLLLSYSNDEVKHAICEAIADEEITLLVVYYFWKKLCQDHPDDVIRPTSMAELNQLLLKLPLLQITAMIRLFENYQWSVACPPDNPIPHKLIKEFFNFINGD
ncbi:ankyrin repeat domain-containing protein [Endozoicomonas sp. SCSIO W0465]|uniref:ankyrin repeat domain-containing protein n=1 Tax=Endozoicomonas sp. SCSIO W0465 TaxID=2918516 RepID=UPI002075E9DD|nr:ankyrin repeat domain-containing protein [Endozoicomonas sp. SCSIO W0465]USE36179.1 ankyrin repeat domain-containing protein [Endozoicomonas sp. SCSIO W0465]